MSHRSLAVAALLLIASCASADDLESGFQNPPPQQNGQFTSGFGALVPINGTPGARTGALIGRLTF